MKQKKYISKKEALQKLQRYCAYQERCHQEVRTKLLGLGIYGDELEEIIVELIQENFLNEERFAKSYARGKYRFKKWGRLKIQRELKQRHISAYCLRKAMEEIDEEEYLEILQKLLHRKYEQLGAENTFANKQKMAAHAMRKGFESDLIWTSIHELLEEKD